MPFQDLTATEDFTHSEWLVRCPDCASRGNTLDMDKRTRMRYLPGCFKPPDEEDISCPECGSQDLERSIITFRSARPSEDERLKITQLATRNKTNYNRKEARAARKRGEDYDAQMETEVKHSVVLATIFFMGKGCKGPEFEFHVDFKDPVAGKTYRQGETMAWTLQMLGHLLPEDQAEDIEEFMSDLYTGKSEEEAARFRAGPRSVGGSTPQASARKQGEPAGDPLPADFEGLAAGGDDSLDARSPQLAVVD